MTNTSGWGGPRATALRALLHQRMRDTWAHHHEVICPRCGLPIHPGQAWDTGHRIPVTQRPDLMFNPANIRAEHASCNRADGANTTNQLRTRTGGGWRW